MHCCSTQIRNCTADVTEPTQKYSLLCKNHDPFLFFLDVVSTPLICHLDQRGLRGAKKYLTLFISVLQHCSLQLTLNEQSPVQCW